MDPQTRADNEALCYHIDRLRGERDTAKAECTRLSSLLASVEADRSSYRLTRATLESARAKAIAEKETASIELAKSQQHLASLGARLQRTENELEAARRQLKDMQLRAEVKLANGQLEGEVQKLRHDLEAERARREKDRQRDEDAARAAMSNKWLAAMASRLSRD